MGYTDETMWKFDVLNSSMQPTSHGVTTTPRTGHSHQAACYIFYRLQSACGPHGIRYSQQSKPRVAGHGITEHRHYRTPLAAAHARRSPVSNTAAIHSQRSNERTDGMSAQCTVIEHKATVRCGHTSQS